MHRGVARHLTPAGRTPGGRWRPRSGRRGYVVASYLAHGSWVLCDNGVGGEQQNALDCRLCDEQAIKGILVDRRQSGDRDGVLAGDRQFIVSIVQQAATQEPRIRTEIVAAEAGFDRDFPQAQRR